MPERPTGKKLIIKIGTGVLTRSATGTLHHAMIARLTQAIADLVAEGHQCVVVSSGAVGAGLSSFGLDSYPEETEMRQACAAVGQSQIMHLYETHFTHHQLKVAQLLLTHDDLKNEKKRNNVLHTLVTLLRFPHIVPIVNENDSVAVFELKSGDNDTLSSIVGELIGADMLLLLTSVPGLRGPGSNDENDIIPLVEDVDSVLPYANDEKGALSIGGMRSKLEAVRRATHAGIETVIAGGRAPEQLSELVNGRGIGTRFPARKSQAASRKS